MCGRALAPPLRLSLSLASLMAELVLLLSHLCSLGRGGTGLALRPCHALLEWPCAMMGVGKIMSVVHSDEAILLVQVGAQERAFGSGI